MGSPSPEEPALSAAKGRGGQGVRTLSGLEETGDGDQAAIHRIGGQPEALEREDTEDRFRARLSEYDDRRLRALADLDLYPRHRISHLASVGQHEGPFLFRCHAELFQDVPRDPRLGGTRVDERLDALEALPGPIADLDGDPEVAHP